MKINKNFNLIIAGIGGQGQLTLLKILAEAALLEKKDVKTSELHGLSQRGGSVEVHLRIGEKIFSPLISEGQADLVLALEIQEALRNCYFASKERGTIFLINDFFVPISGKSLNEKKELLKNLGKFAKEVILIGANDLCQKELGTSLVAGIFLIAFACQRKLIPLEEKTIKKSLKKIIPSQFLGLNLKTFDLAKKYESGGYFGSR